MINYIIDALLILIVFISMIVGAKRGFIKTVAIKPIKILVSIFAAFKLCGKGALIIEDKYILPPISSKLSGYFEGVSGELTAENASDNTPVVIRFLANLMGVDINEVAGNADGDIAGALADSLASPVAHAVSSVIAFIVIYILARVLLWLCVLLVDGIFSAPGLSIVNSVLGAIFGIAVGLMFAWLCALVINSVAPLLDGKDFFKDYSLENTYVLKRLCGFDPLEYILNLK